MGSIKDMLADKEQGICPFCKRPVDESQFRDEISLREYKISGLCQCCQDDFFD